MRKRYLIFITVVLLIVIISQLSITQYLWMQGKGQWKVLVEARPIVEWLEDENVPDSVKYKIRLIADIKAFAKAELDMDGEDKYSSIFNQQGKEILWNLTACRPFELKSKEWYFPIVGHVSYKGFFDMEKAVLEEQELLKEDWDTRIRPVNAWSTLGWFDDPILSNTLKRSDGDLAELIIHEITHSYIYFKDSTQFDENMASFVGEEGAKLFLIQKFGKDSQPYIHYMNEEHDYALFINHALKGCKELKILYDYFNDEMPTAEKKSLKEAYINEWMNALEQLPFTDDQHFDRLKASPPNNAFFMAFDRYAAKQDMFRAILANDFHNDLKAFILHFSNQ